MSTVPVTFLGSDYIEDILKFSNEYQIIVISKSIFSLNNDLLARHNLENLQEEFITYYLAKNEEPLLEDFMEEGKSF